MLKGNIKPTYPDCEGKHPLKLHLSSKLKKTKKKQKVIHCICGEVLQEILKVNKHLKE